jgi:hypothetical protein
MLYYTTHARRRMRERNISEKEVEYCISHWDIDYIGKTGNFIYTVHTETGRFIKVIIDKDSTNPLKVITVGD